MQSTTRRLSLAASQSNCRTEHLLSSKPAPSRKGAFAAVSPAAGPTFGGADVDVPRVAFTAGPVLLGKHSNEGGPAL